MTTAEPPLIPARMLNEHVYCPRLAYLEWVDHRFADNQETVEGRWAHRVVDRERGGIEPLARADPHLDVRPEPAVGGDASRNGEESPPGEDPPRATSITLGSDELGLIAKIDILEPRGDTVVPVEVKRGRPAAPKRPLYDPERVQLCAHALLLREHGYRVDHGEVYFAQARRRYHVELDGELERMTRAAIASLRASAAREVAPAPLVDSPKCPRCSLVGLCLPDEVNVLRERSPGPPRRLVAKDPAATPLYATTAGARLTKRRGRIVLREHGEVVAERRVIDVSHIAVFGNVDVSSALLRNASIAESRSSG